MGPRTPRRADGHQGAAGHGNARVNRGEKQSPLTSVQAMVVDEQTRPTWSNTAPVKPVVNRTGVRNPTECGKHVVWHVAATNPRWHRCACQNTGPLTFRPTTQWLTGLTSPELLYFESKWDSLIP